MVINDTIPFIDDLVEDFNKVQEKSGEWVNITL